MPPSSPPPSKSPFVWMVGRKDRAKGTVPTWVPRRDRGALYIWEWAIIAIIIGIIFSLGLPAYKRSAGAAKAVACSSNLQHLHQMFSMYVQDYDGVYPPLPVTGNLDLALRPIQQDHDAWTNRLASYREERGKEKQEPFNCPASQEEVMTYAYNAALGGRIFPEYDPKGQAVGEAEIEIPTQTYLVWDTANKGGANAISGYKYWSGTRRDGKYVIGDLVLPARAVKKEWLYPRHNGAAAVLFCDGHISRLSNPGIRQEQTRNPFDPRPQVPVVPVASPTPAAAESVKPE